MKKATLKIEMTHSSFTSTWYRATLSADVSDVDGIKEETYSVEGYDSMPETWARKMAAHLDWDITEEK